MAVFKQKEKINAPVSGKLFPLTKVSDPVFSQGLMGEGFAIDPVSAKVCAPADSVIKAVFPTKHALTLTSDNGLDILIHIGIDTIRLNGVGFQVEVGEGQKVNSGETLVIFDPEQIKAEKLDDTVMVLFPEAKNLNLKIDEKDVQERDLIFKN